LKYKTLLQDSFARELFQRDTFLSVSLDIKFCGFDTEFFENGSKILEGFVHAIQKYRLFGYLIDTFRQVFSNFLGKILAMFF